MRKVCREDREEKKIIVPQNKMHKGFFQEMKLFKEKAAGTEDFVEDNSEEIFRKWVFCDRRTVFQ